VKGLGGGNKKPQVMQKQSLTTSRQMPN